MSQSQSLGKATKDGFSWWCQDFVVLQIINLMSYTEADVVFCSTGLLFLEASAKT